MGQITSFKKENLIIGILSTLPQKEEELIHKLQDNFGKIDYTSPVFDFKWTSYYNSEMGNNIKRFFLSFKNLVNPEELSSIKHLTNKIETSFSISKNRKINIDPGLLDLNRLILATTKNVGHRIPLKDGIYAEVTLMYMKKDFHPLAWTYPDYKSPKYITVLKTIRELYKEKIKNIPQIAT